MTKSQRNKIVDVPAVVQTVIKASAAARRLCQQFCQMYHLTVILTQYVSKVNSTNCVIYTERGDAMMKYERIRAMREDNDFRQQDIAKYLNISRSAYSNYENGLREVPVAVLEKIAEFYKTSVDYLIGKTDVVKPYPKSEQR